MSGILAVLRRRDQEVDPTSPSCVGAILQAASYRAVDGQSTWHGAGVALAHQRFDPFAASGDAEQPLFRPGAGLAITADARLDVECRRRLGQVLPVDSERGDAALILSAYQRWGLGCLDHLRGDFAFAIWDGASDSLVLARDVLGVRDLCWYEDSAVFAAASESGQLLRCPSVTHRVDETRVAQFLADRWDNEVDTFFASIKHCPPGHFLVADRQGTRRQRFREIAGSGRLGIRSQEEYDEELRSRLHQSVRNRLPARGEAVVSLSGGPDSAALAATLAQEQPGRIKTISYVFDRHPSCDERDYVREVTELLGAESRLLPVDDLWPLSEVPTWPVYRDFPAQDPYVRLPMAVADAARELGSRVVFYGHFSDVLFSARGMWAQAVVAERDLGWVARELWRAPSGARQRAVIDLARALAPRRMKSLRRRVMAGTRRSLGLLDRDLARRTGLDHHRPESPAGDRASVIRALQKRRLTRAVEPLGASAFRSLSNPRTVEYVDPFWDPALVELVMDLPPAQLARPTSSKWLLRSAYSRSLPQRVTARQGKTSLYDFMADGLLRREAPTVRGLLTRPHVVQAGFVDGEWLSAELRRAQAGRWSDFGYHLWRCLCLELWLRRCA